MASGLLKRYLFCVTRYKCVLNNVISALRIVVEPDGVSHSGLFTQLPKGSEVELCGDEEDQRLVRIKSGKSLYLAFRQDLPLA